MGADIHCVVQVRVVENKWVTVNVALCGETRNYKTFGILAGVRGGDDPIASPRGLPADFEIVEDNSHPLPLALQNEDDGKLYWMGDHSHSYYTLAELQDYPQDYWIRGSIEEPEEKNKGHYPQLPASECEIMTDAEYKLYKESDEVVFDFHDWIHKSRVDHTYIPQLITELESVRQAHNVTREDVRLVFGFDN